MWYHFAMDKQIAVSITPGTIITTLVIATLAFAVWTLRDLVLLVLTAIVLATAIEPGVMFFVRRKLPRALAVFLMYVAMLGSLFGTVYFVFPPLLNDAQSFIMSVPELLDTVDLPAVDEGVSNMVLLQEAGAQSQSFVDTVLSFQSALTETGEGAIRLISMFFGGIFSFLLVMVLSFYFAVRNTGVEEFLRVILPSKHEEYVVGLWHRAQRKIGLWIQGQLILSLIIGVITYLGLLIIGVPYALLLAILASFFNLIPIFGSLIAGLVATAVAFGAGGITMAVITASLFLIVNQFEGNLIYPLIVDKVVGIPPLLVILALIAGGSLAGFLGILLAVPLAAALREFVADLDKGKRARAGSA